MICPSCGADLPADARFCIECGTALAQPATDVTIKLPASQPAMLCRNCGAPNPADAIFCVRCGRRHSELARPRLYVLAPLAPAPAPSRRPRRGAGGRGLAPAIFLIGCGLLMLVGKAFFWPGLLILVGLGAFVHEAGHGRLHRGLAWVVWMFGLLLAFSMPRLFIPIVLLSVAATVVLGTLRRP